MKKLNSDILKKNIGEKIKFFRKKKGLSQEELAEKINLEMKSLSRIESGHNYPQCENLIAISNALEIAPWQLYFMKNDDLEKMKREISENLHNENILISLYQCLKMQK
ncbi:helix-turn-helix transcriptional regulator [bacterium]|nr:helix-turn-helix transcriptional regulator [bacterium]